MVRAACPEPRRGTLLRKAPLKNGGCLPRRGEQAASKWDRPSFLSDDVLVHPCRVQLRAVRPRQNTQLDGHLGKKLRIGQRAEDSCIGRSQQSRAIGDTACPITEGNRQPMAGQYRYCLNAPRRGGRYSSGRIFLGCCLAWHRFQSSINSARCSTAHSIVRPSARRGSEPAITSRTSG